MKVLVSYLLCVACSCAASEEPQVKSASVSQLFSDAKFSELDRLAQDARRQVPVADNFVSDLARFYEVIPTPKSDDPDNVWENFESKFKSWLKSIPDSLTARIALSELYIRWGWKLRTLASHNAPSFSGSSDAKEKFQAAAATLAEASGLGIKDPELYAALIRDGAGLGWSKSDIDNKFDAGKALWPGYYPLYQSKAIYLLPELYGGLKEELDFATTETNQLHGDASDELYALIADGIVRNVGLRIFEDTGLAWDRIRTGLLSLIRKSQDQSFQIRLLNSLAYIAFAARDNTVAALILRSLSDDQIDLALWGSKEAAKSVILQKSGTH